MTTIESKLVEVSAPIQDVYSFLINLNNIQKLIPEERISSWESTEDTCAFTIKGLAGISLKRGDCTENQLIHLISHGKNPFDFSLDLHINEDMDNTTVKLIFEGNLNFMLQTLATTPLTNLFNMMADKLVEHFEVTA